MVNWLESSDPDLSGIDVDANAPVLVTGASGYVAGWIVKGLLDAGCTVHACVRNPNDAAKTAHLVRLAEVTPGQLHLFAADLLKQGSYVAAMEGCGVVIHTATPFIRKVDDPRRQLVAPALDGTRNVLASVEATTSVRRVVVTSSVAAMYTDSVECARRPGGVLDEEAWNSTASLDYEPYSYAKTLAEKAAWDAFELQREPRRWRLVTINPALVVGPHLAMAPSVAAVSDIAGKSREAGVRPAVAAGRPVVAGATVPGPAPASSTKRTSNLKVSGAVPAATDAPTVAAVPPSASAPTSDSFAIVRMLIDGTARFGVPRVGVGLVDVRDVARAHIAAAFLPQARGRYLVCAYDTDLATVGKVLGPRFGSRLPLPKRALPKPLLRAVGPAFGMSRRYVAGNVNHAFRSNARKSREELNMIYRPFRASLEDMVSQMLG